ADGEPGVELLQPGVGLLRPRRSRGLGRGVEGDRERHDERAGAPQELAAVHLHAASPAARLTARRMRMCVPQRQRLPSMALRMSVSLGFGFLASKAAAVMTIPLMQ